MSFYATCKSCYGWMGALHVRLEGSHRLREGLAALLGRQLMGCLQELEATWP